MEDVIFLKEAIGTLGEDVCLALFCTITLDNAHGAQRFSEAARDLGVDSRPFTEDRPGDSECFS